MSDPPPSPNPPLWDEAIRLRDAGEIEAATKPLRELVASEPSLAPAHALLAHLLRKLGRLEEAATEFRIATEIRPKNWLF